MYQKLDNAAWEKYINEYSSLDKKISIKSFCKERNINPSQFFYHRKRIASADKPVVLQAINFKVITTRKTGGLHCGYKPLLLGQRLKAPGFHFVQATL